MEGTQLCTTLLLPFTETVLKQLLPSFAGNTALCTLKHTPVKKQQSLRENLFHLNPTQQGFITGEQMKPQDFNLSTGKE